MKKLFATLSCALLWLATMAQPTISADVAANELVCIGKPVKYRVTFPSGLSPCSYTWSVKSGITTLTSSDINASFFDVTWADQKPNKVEVQVVVRYRASNVACTSSAETATLTFTHILRTVFEEKIFLTNAPSTIDFCSTANVGITVSQMFIPKTGTGSIVLQTEVNNYEWVLPTGWRQVGSNNPGTVLTNVNSILIQPVPGSCSERGTVVVRGIANNTSCPNLPVIRSKAENILLNSTSPTASVTPQAGFTGTTACNETPVSFTAVVTNNPGCAITSYQWILPPSWSLVSQSGNTASLRPSGNVADASSIKVKVTFGCGSTREPIFTPTFNVPVINGSFNVCTGGTNFTLTNAGANSVNWAPSSNMVVNTGQGTATANIKATNSTSRGAGAINASFPACPAVPISPRSVWVGVPNQITDILKGSGSIAIGATVPFSIQDPNNPNTGLVTYDWDVAGGYFSWIDTYAWTNITDPYLVLYAGSRNVCGSLGMISRGWNTDNGGCPPGEICEMSVYPNPTSDQFLISLPSNSIKGAPTSVKLVDSNGTPVYTRLVEKNTMHVQIPTAELKDGTYILSITQGRTTKQKQLIIRH